MNEFKRLNIGYVCASLTCGASIGGMILSWSDLKFWFYVTTAAASFYAAVKISKELRKLKAELEK